MYKLRKQNMKEKLDQILKKDMNRKEFLLTLGFGVASLVGLKSMLSSLDSFIDTSHSQKKQSQGYGSSNYGS